MKKRALSLLLATLILIGLLPTAAAEGAAGTAVTITYAVILEAGGTLDRSSEAVTAGQAALGATATANQGYHFVGWFRDEACEEQDKVGTETTFKPTEPEGGWADATYYAKFAPDTDTEYTVRHWYENRWTAGLYEEDSFYYTEEKKTGTTGATVTAEPLKKIRTGYVYDPDSSTTSDTILADGSLKLILKYKARRYTITWMSEGAVFHTSTGVPETYPASGFMPISDPIKTNYQFLGWSKTENGTELADMDEKISANQTYYAVFAAKAHLRYDRVPEAYGKISNSDSTSEWLYGDDVAAGATIVLYDGYKVAGWFTDKDCTQALDPAWLSNGGKTIRPQKPESGWADATYYARLVEDPMNTISYAVGSGSGTGSVSRTAETLRSSAEPAGAVATAADGYVFAGWYSDAGCSRPVPRSWVTGTTLRPQRNAEVLYDEITYYAKFEAQDTTHTVTWVIDGEKADTTTVTVGKNASYEGNLKKTYYTFDGWYLDADYKTRVTPESEQITGNVTYYGRFLQKPVSVRVTHVKQDTLGGSTYTRADENTADTGWLVDDTVGSFVERQGWIKSYSGYTLDQSKASNAAALNIKWTDTEESAAGTVEATLEYDLLPNITIRYETQTGGTVSAAQEELNPEIGTPTGTTATADPGYRFAGWYSNEGRGQNVPDGWVSGNKLTPQKSAAGRYEAATYYAKFVPLQSITITYRSTDTNLGTVSPATDTLNPEIGTPMGATATANRRYRLEGWYRDEACTDKITDEAWVSGAKLTPQKNAAGHYEAATYYAKFVELDHIDIRFLTNDTSFGRVSPDLYTVNPETDAELVAKVYPKDGYQLEGWYLDRERTQRVPDAWMDGTELKLQKNAAGRYEAATYYAKFVAKQYEVQWIDGQTGGRWNVIKSETLAYGAPTAYTGEAREREGYIFLGWNTNPAATTALAALPAVMGPMHFYAIYQELEHVQIAYWIVEDEGGDLSTETEGLNPVIGVPTGSQPGAALGYTFVGWFCDEACANPVPPEWVRVDGTLVPEKMGDQWQAATYWAKFTRQQVVLDLDNPENLAEPTAADALVQKKLKITRGSVKEAFTVQLEAMPVALSAVGTDVDRTFPDGKHMLVGKTAEMSKDGEVQPVLFGAEQKLTFTFTGSTRDYPRRYSYRVYEVPGKIGDMTYDQTTYLLVVEIALDKEENRLYLSRLTFSKVEDGELAPAQALIFTNTYHDSYYPPAPQPTPKDNTPAALNAKDHVAYVIGYPDGGIHPNATITRAEVATIFFRLLTAQVRDANYTAENDFTDVAADKWYNTAVSTMTKLGVLTGYPDGTFRPNAPITRAEFAAIAARFDGKSAAQTAAFGDVSGHWALRLISRAAELGWIQGYADGNFQPNQNITRAEAMALVNRMLCRNPSSPEDLLQEMKTWNDNLLTTKWYYLDVQEAGNSHTFVRKTDGREKWKTLTADPDWKALER